jgi:hypothetical protein
MRRRIPDITKATNLIGFHPQHQLDRIVKDVAEDLRARLPLEQMRWSAVEYAPALQRAHSVPPGGNGQHSTRSQPSLTNGVAR